MVNSKSIAELSQPPIDRKTGKPVTRAVAGKAPRFRYQDEDQRQVLFPSYGLSFPPPTQSQPGSKVDNKGSMLSPPTDPRTGKPVFRAVAGKAPRFSWEREDEKRKREQQELKELRQKQKDEQRQREEERSHAARDQDGLGAAMSGGWSPGAGHPDESKTKLVSKTSRAQRFNYNDNRSSFPGPAAYYPKNYTIKARPQSANAKPTMKRSESPPLRSRAAAPLWRTKYYSVGVLQLGGAGLSKIVYIPTDITEKEHLVVFEPPAQGPGLVESESFIYWFEKYMDESKCLVDDHRFGFRDLEAREANKGNFGSAVVPSEPVPVVGRMFVYCPYAPVKGLGPAYPPHLEPKDVETSSSHEEREAAVADPYDHNPLDTNPRMLTRSAS